MNERDPHNPNLPKRYDWYTRPPYPEALLKPEQHVLILNLHEPFSTGPSSAGARRLLRDLVGSVDNIFSSASLDGEVKERRNKFEKGVKEDLEIAPGVISFQRTQILELPEEMYEPVKEPTVYSWGRLAVWDQPAHDAVMAFGLTPEDCLESEIIIIPPHQNNLQPYVAATQELLGKTPHFAQYTEIQYAPSVSWQVTEYRDGLVNYMGVVSGAL